MNNHGPRIAVIGVPGDWSTEALANALSQRTGFRMVVALSEVSCDLTQERVFYRSVNLCELDGLIVKKVDVSYSPATLDRLEMLRFITAQGVPVFSDPQAILRLVDRLAGTVTLRSAGIPMPPTTITENLDWAVAAVQTYGGAVLKPLYSTKARGMEVIEWSNETDVRATLQAFNEENPILYIQKKISLPGRDLGVVFLGEDYVGTYARVSGNGSWNTTIHSGGHYEAHEPLPETIEVARRAREAFGLDFTSVDVVEDEDGPLVFEVSAFGGFRGLRDGLGVNIADHYADYVLERLGHA